MTKNDYIFKNNEKLEKSTQFSQENITEQMQISF